MSFLAISPFLFFGASLVSLWIRRDPKVWGSLFGASLACALATGNLTPIGLIFVLALMALWMIYRRKPTLAIFVLLIFFSALFKMHLLSGYLPLAFTSKFRIGLEAPLIGLFPLVFLSTAGFKERLKKLLSPPFSSARYFAAIPLARSAKDWASALKGAALGIGGIMVMALLATFSGASEWEFKKPTFFSIRLLSNLFLICIPEEGFYRGFLQNTFCSYFEEIKGGKWLALLLTSILFTAAHVYWSPNLEILLFVFLASLLYGGVYLISGKIESAILTHFLLNFTHMAFFSYHAM